MTCWYGSGMVRSAASRSSSVSFSGIGGTNAYPYPGDLSDNGVSSSTSITFNVPIDAPGTLYYACGQHFSMIGTIQVVHDLVFRDRFDL